MWGGGGNSHHGGDHGGDAAIPVHVPEKVRASAQANGVWVVSKWLMKPGDIAREGQRLVSLRRGDDAEAAGQIFGMHVLC